MSQSNPMQYMINGISNGQMTRYYNALEEVMEHAGQYAMDPDDIKVEVDGEDKSHPLDINGEYVETYYTDVLGFKVKLFTVEHKGLIKVFKDEDGIEVRCIVLMPVEFDEN